MPVLSHLGAFVYGPSTIPSPGLMVTDIRQHGFDGALRGGRRGEPVLALALGPSPDEPNLLPSF